MGDLFFKSFDVRFGEILERMRFHQKVVHDETQWAFLSDLQDKANIAEILKKAEQEEQRRLMAMTSELSQDIKSQSWQVFLQHVFRWLRADDNKSVLDRHLNTKEEDTAEWLFRQPKFTSWRDDDGPPDGKPSILWVRGNPGWGKSILAASTIQELLSRRDESQQMPTEAICYYFFSHENAAASSSTEAYRALLAQLFSEHKSLENISSAFSLALAKSGHSASHQELLDLLGLCLQILPPTTILLDGIDECTEPNALLRDLCNLRGGGPDLRLLLFSRPNVAYLHRRLGEPQTIQMSREVTDTDIAVYLHRGLQELQDDQLIPQGTNTEDLVEHLLQRAEGMFLWAKLMVTYLHSPALTLRSRQDAIFRTTPKGLHEMYCRIFSIITKSDEASQDLAMKSFMWIAHASSPLRAVELQGAFRDPCALSSELDLVPEIESAIQLTTAGLLEMRSDQTFHFIHQTAREFVLEAKATGSSGLNYVQSGEQAHASIAMHCLRYLMFAVPAQPLSITIGTFQSQSIDDTVPLLPYSCESWFHHMCAALSLVDDGDAAQSRADFLSVLRTFLATPLTLMVWLEAVYTCSMGTITIRALQERSRQLSDRFSHVLDLNLKAVLSDLQEFAQDLGSVTSAWDAALSTNPAEIWNDITAFTPSRFFHQTAALAVQGIKMDSPAEIRDEGELLWTVSKTSIDLTRLATVTVCPSREFCQLWRTGHVQSAERVEQLLHSCEGWNALYEIFDISGQPVRRSATTVPLCANEVSLRLRQSLRYDKIGIPVAISDSLTRIALLRTVVCIQPSEEDTTEADVCSCTLETQLLDRQSSNWDGSRMFNGLEYYYQVLFSPDEKFVIFHDYDLLHMSSNIGAYRLCCEDSVCQALLLNHMQMERHSYVAPVLHHYLQIALFVWKQHIFSWHFAQDTPQLTMLAAFPALGHPAACDVDFEIGFSECGNFYTVKHYSQAWPAIHPLPASPGVLNALGSGESTSPPTSARPVVRKRMAEEELAPSTDSKKVQLPFRMPPLRNDVVCLDHSEQSATSAIITHKNTPQMLELSVASTAGGTDNITSLELLSVPSHIDLRHTSSSVRWQSEQDEKIRIILTRRSPRYYCASDRKATEAALVIDRDARFTQRFQSLNRPHLQLPLCLPGLGPLDDGPIPDDLEP
ncbi:hypothetical protein A1O3_05941 [Capronia epimyces CBS 606.96]|uniref:Nephrocystin 3-like N-terminal domain-containing protein n=1 Tax=Capronia epimyces CBS 606.96 TaxID=1182542 RepID=W9Y7N3_9EURO|nr:uncharacterized protein A1O3_05941 [Capronia epimyces CBS 606.96]EXJ85266.1 hypothetical protein A1O3_05941 [Capronia epimyces CBS 606.96]